MLKKNAYIEITQKIDYNIKTWKNFKIGIKMGRLLSFIVLSITLFVSFALSAKIYIDPQSKNITKKAHVFDVCVLLDAGVDTIKAYKNKRTPSILGSMNRIILQNQAVIVSDAIINLLCKISENTESLFAQQYQNKAQIVLEHIIKHNLIYVSKQEAFAIIIPVNTYDDILPKNILHDTNIVCNLETLGLTNNVTRIPNDKQSIQDAFEKITYEIDIEILNELFSDSPNAKKIKKRIYVGGHGSFAQELRKPARVAFTPSKDVAFAGLSYQQYSQFLERLKKVTCDFLYIKSCYIGGWNQLTIQTKQDEIHENIFKKIDLPFPIVFGSLTDSTSSLYKKANWKNYFRELHTFLSKPITNESNRTWLLQKAWLNKKPLALILKHIAGDLIQNQPSIKIPGIPVSQAIPLGNTVEMLTYPFLLLHEFQTHMKGLPNDFFIFPGIRHILLYPIITMLPIHIMLSQEQLTYAQYYPFYPRFISMVPGKAHHFIKKITIPAKGCDLKAIFTLFGYKKDVSPRLFFIPELQIAFKSNITKNPFGIKRSFRILKLENVAIKTTGTYGEYTFKINDSHFEKERNNYFYATYTPQMDEKIKRKQEKTRKKRKEKKQEHTTTKKLSQEEKEQKRKKKKSKYGWNTIKFIKIPAKKALSTIQSWTMETTPTKEALHIETEKKFRHTIDRYLHPLQPKKSYKPLANGAKTFSEKTINNALQSILKQALQVQISIKNAIKHKINPPQKKRKPKRKKKIDIQTQHLCNIKTKIHNLINNIQTKATENFLFFKTYKVPMVIEALKKVEDLITLLQKTLEQKTKQNILAHANGYFNLANNLQDQGIAMLHKTEAPKKNKIATMIQELLKQTTKNITALLQAKTIQIIQNNIAHFLQDNVEKVIQKIGAEIATIKPKTATFKEFQEKIQHEIEALHIYIINKLIIEKNKITQLYESENLNTQALELLIQALQQLDNLLLNSKQRQKKHTTLETIRKNNDNLQSLQSRIKKSMLTSILPSLLHKTNSTSTAILTTFHTQLR